MSSGSRIAPELTLTLSAPHLSTRSKSSTVLMPPPTVSGMKTVLRRSREDVGEEPPPLGGGGDVVEHQLVRAAGAVVFRQLHRGGDIRQTGEIDALDHPAVPHVQAGDDAFGNHLPPPIASSRSIAPGVIGLADDGAVQPISAARAHPPGRDAAGGDDVKVERLRQLPVQRPVRALHGAVPGDIRADQRFHAQRLQLGAEVLERPARSLRPALDGHEAVPDVHAHGDPPAPRPDSGPRPPCCGCRRRSRRSSRCGSRSADTLEISASAVLAPSRSTMWMCSAPAAAKSSGNGRGVVAVDRHLRVVALVEADGLAVKQIDRGKQDHSGHSISQNARRMFNPTSPLFSGWNWQPMTLPRCTAAVSSRRIPPWRSRLSPQSAA